MHQTRQGIYISGNFTTNGLGKIYTRYQFAYRSAGEKSTILSSALRTIYIPPLTKHQRDKTQYGYEKGYQQQPELSSLEIGREQIVRSQDMDLRIKYCTGWSEIIQTNLIFSVNSRIFLKKCVDLNTFKIISVHIIYSYLFFAL